MGMAVDRQAFLRVQASAFNGHDLPTILAHTDRRTMCIRDGEYLGDGPEAIGRAFRDEWARPDVVVRVMDVGGVPAMVQWTSAEGGEPCGLVRLEGAGGRLTGCCIEHDPDLLRRLVDTARRAEAKRA